MSRPALPIRILAAVGRALDRVRKVLHFVLLFFIALLVLGLFSPGAIVPNRAALVIAPQGVLVEQLSGDPLSIAIARAGGAPLAETLQRSVVNAIRAGRDDPRIKVLVLRLDGLTGGGLSKLQELADEVAYFKESGKPVIALGDSFTRDQYYLAAHADQVILNPMGSIVVDGYSRYLPYYKSALDKLYVDYHVWTVGEYKSFVEPVTRDDMSAEDREATLAFLGGLWQAYQSDVAAARGLEAGALQRYADEIPELLRAAGGDTAQLALDYGLADAVMPRDGMRARIRELVGETAADVGAEGYTGIDFQTYLGTFDGDISVDRASGKVAILVASGTILDGAQPPGSIGGDSTAALIREVAADDDVKALVLRVDSGGGSAFASEIIRRELEVFRETGRPVVVSMGSVAASGGYWIAMAADEIWASPTTLTGSIGVGATLPTFQRSLEQLGVNFDGVGTTDLSEGFNIALPLEDDVRELIAQTVDSTYRQFIGMVAEERERSEAQIDQVARGRVWIGSEALNRDLVDRLGTLEDALDSAAQLAGLEEGSYEVEYVEPRLGVLDQLLFDLTARVWSKLGPVVSGPKLPDAVTQWIETAMEPLAFAERWNDPRGVYAYCFCDVR
jgi:protease-4